MKKFIGFLVAAMAVFALAANVMASDISVKVDGRTVTFREDPKPIVMNDRTYVPVRRVLEFMGAKLAWNEEKRTVTVTSWDNITVVVLTIDSPEVNVYTFTSVLHADKETITSDVAPIIVNDRTMLPIRVIAEALGADVEYDESGIAEITTVQAKNAMVAALGNEAKDEKNKVEAVFSENLPKISIYSDAEDVKEGDTVFVYVRISDIDKFSADAKFVGIATTVLYDKDNFSYDGFKCISIDGETEPAISAGNGEFYENGAKIVYIYNTNNLKEAAEDGTVMAIEFTALNDNGGVFALSDGISEIGYDNEIVLLDGDQTKSVSKYTELYIDTTEIEVK